MERNIFSLVKREASNIKSKMTADVLFQRPEIHRQAKSLVSAVTKRYGESIEVNLFFDPSKNVTAFTDGKSITVNTGNDLISFFENLYGKYMAYLGMLFHEVSHILFSDFTQEEIMRSALIQGHLFGKEPDVKSKEEEESLNEMLQALQKEEYRPIFVSMYDTLTNIISDAHDEDKLMEEKGGIVETAILTVREALEATLMSLEQMNEKQFPKLAIIYNLTLQFCRWDRILMEDEAEGYKSEEVKNLMCMATPLNIARGTDDAVEKNNEINKIMFFLWPYIKETIEQMKPSQNGQSGQSNQNGRPGQSGQNGQPGQSAQSNPSESQVVNEVLSQLNQGASHAALTQAVKNGMTSQAKKQQQKYGGSGSKGQASTERKEDAASKAVFDSLLNTVATAQAEKIIQDNITNETNIEIAAISMSSTHEGKTVTVIPCTEITEKNVVVYEDTMNRLRSYTKRLIREMQQVLKDQQLGDVQHGRLIGNKFEANQSYRKDGCCFAKMTLPQEYPEKCKSQKYPF